MDDVMIRLLRYGSKGYTCSQILLLMALELRGEEDPALVRSMAGLAYGCGGGSGTCGALTGGSCLLALYAGKGADDETGSERLMVMLQELSDWFTERVGEQYGGIECNAVVGEAGPGGTRERCGAIVAETFTKAMEILESNGFDPSEA